MGNANVPAFPNNGETLHDRRGLTKREYFAMHFMAASIVAYPSDSADEHSRRACLDADELLRALEK